MLLSGLSIISLTVYFFLNLDLTTVLLIPSGAAILVYVIGSASGIKLLKRRRVYPWISLVISLIMLPFVGILLVASLVPAVLGFLYNPKIESAAVTVSGERSVVRN
jgi:amino acid efflux transporter